MHCTRSEVLILPHFPARSDAGGHAGGTRLAAVRDQRRSEDGRLVAASWDQLSRLSASSGEHGPSRSRTSGLRS